MTRAKEKRREGFKRVSIWVSPEISAALDALVGTGLYGQTAAAVAEMFVRDRVREEAIKMSRRRVK
jgi:hypothetical protein